VEEKLLDVNMHAMVSGCVNMYKQEGINVLLNDLIHNGTQDFQSSMWNARAARLVVGQLTREGIPNIEGLEQALRFEALHIFREYWSAVSLSRTPMGMISN
jgi:hypothetical protein